MANMDSNEDYAPREGAEPQPDSPGGSHGPPPQGAPPPSGTAPPPPGYGYGAARPGSGQNWPGATRTFGFDPRQKNVPLACFLSLMPGLGQIYVGYYIRGFVHILVVGSVIAILSEEPVRELMPLFGIFLPFFWLYNVVDAGRRAALYNAALDGGSPVPEAELPGGGTILGGLALVAIGVLMLMNTAFDFSMQWLAEWWPLAPIIFGAYLVIRGASARSRKEGY